ncbi:hypothetical protein [Neoroseomonas oryzicola]|uniref:Uncharacterized protein n=1 Tax=Neoroseomonas oryzicola TaxID=535904 RepID=A0A9X9WLY1_9PROT|nr:hypothetical protein [Neoroseomonas oryzicola]MBR0661341.1 hypothetical protein [Neoroseomonas oryzicola]NKE18831.1 hypothetical protein [Neoroseomonas oryzicola]
MPRGQRSDATPADPANRPLTERQRRLVEIALQAASDGRLLSRRQLGEASGFGSGDVARVQASRTLGLPHVRAAIVAGVREQAQTDAADSYATLRFIARKARSTRDRLGAAREVLSIAGVTGSEGGYTGPPVALQIVFRSPDAAALLQAAPVVHAVTQRPAVPHMAEE